MAEEEEIVPLTEEVTPLAAPAVRAAHLMIMPSADAAVKLDWSAHPTFRYGDLLVLAVADVVKKHGLT